MYYQHSIVIIYKAAHKWVKMHPQQHTQPTGMSLHCTPPTNTPIQHMQGYQQSKTPSYAPWLYPFPRLTAAASYQTSLTNCILDYSIFHIPTLATMVSTDCFSIVHSFLLFDHFKVPHFYLITFMNSVNYINCNNIEFLINKVLDVKPLLSLLI